MSKAKPLSERLEALAENLTGVIDPVTEAAESLDSKVLRKLVAMLEQLAGFLESESSAAEELENDLDEARAELAEADDGTEPKPDAGEDTKA